MRANKAKRRLLKWDRYYKNTKTVCNHRYQLGYHTGHIMAYDNAANAKRYYPKGIRIPFPLAGWS